MPNRQIHITIEEDDTAKDIITHLSDILCEVAESRKIKDFFAKSDDLDEVIRNIGLPD